MTKMCVFKGIWSFFSHSPHCSALLNANICYKEFVSWFGYAKIVPGAFRRIIVACFRDVKSVYMY